MFKKYFAIVHRNMNVQRCRRKMLKTKGLQWESNWKLYNEMTCLNWTEAILNKLAKWSICRKHEGAFENFSNKNLLVSGHMSVEFTYLFYSIIFFVKLSVRSTIHFVQLPFVFNYTFVHFPILFNYPLCPIAHCVQLSVLFNCLTSGCFIRVS